MNVNHFGGQFFVSSALSEGRTMTWTARCGFQVVGVFLKDDYIQCGIDMEFHKLTCEVCP